MEDYKKLYKQTQRKMKEFIKRWDGIKLSSNDLFTEELKQIVEIENEDESVRKKIIETFKNLGDGKIPVDINYADIFTWLENQGESNPYSGVSFKYNGHTWGMCARDNGVDILLDKQLFKHLEKQNEQKPSVVDFKAEDWYVSKVDGKIYDAKFMENSEKQGEPVEINPSEFDLRLNRLLKQFETLPKEELASSLSFYLNVVQNDGTYKVDEKQGEQKSDSFCREHCKGFQETGKCFADGDCKAKREAEQKTAWSEKQGEEKIADKAESMEHGYITTNPEFFQWIYDRLKYVYNENPNVDYMLSLKERIEDMQKFADKIEPKFKVGDWIIDNKNRVGIIVRILDEHYIISFDGREVQISFEWEGKLFRKWTIQDAKDGDVLAVNKDDVILIFRGIGNEEWNDVIDYYCRYDCYQKEFIVQKDLEFWGYIKDNQLKPATKEQCDTLMKAMADAGWEFDFENKELKKIPNALEECEIEHIEHGKYYYCIKDYYSGGNKRVSKGEVIQALRGMSMMALGVKANEYFIPVKCIIGDRCDWSEEDENAIKVLMNIIRKSEIIDSIIYTDSLKEKLYNCLKSLKDRYTWKPSDEQMKVLDEVLNFAANHESPYWNYYIFETLNNLIRQLKKLKGE